MNRIRSLTAIALAAASIGSFAQAPAAAASAVTPRIDAREIKQEKRIDQGVASGQLTARETQRLEREQTHIAKAEGKAKADGTVTHAERRHIRHLQNGASRDIAHQKHDAQTTVAPAVQTK